MARAEYVLMNQRDLDVLKAMAPVLAGKRTQAEAGRLLGLCVRQVRRIAGRLRVEGDAGVKHQLCGRPGNHRSEAQLKARVLAAYRAQYGDFGPTHASEKLGESGLVVSAETLRQWLLREGLWERQRRRDRHRSRRERRACVGELVQMDSSEHDWLEGRYGGAVELLGTIDDATSRIEARFYAGETTENYMDLVDRYVRKHGRPVALYTDRHGIFRAEDGAGRRTLTQFGRACQELDIKLILARSPQAKGRVERLFGTLQDRWVKELRLAGVCTIAQANVLLEKKLVPEFNRRWSKSAARANNAHRPLGPGHRLASILSIREQRVIGNDYTFQYRNEVYQIPAPALPGMRGGQVTIEERRDGTRHIRFRQHALTCQVVSGIRKKARCVEALPPAPRSLALGPIPAVVVLAVKGTSRRAEAGRPVAVHRPAGCSGRTSALPCPSGGKSCGRGKEAWRPAPSHAWRKPLKAKAPV